jgi:hypothetical protein
MDIKETGWENTKWIYQFQHTGLIVFCEHTNEHCGSVNGGGGGGGYAVNERQLFSSKKSEDACPLGYDNAVRWVVTDVSDDRTACLLRD